MAQSLLRERDPVAVAWAPYDVVQVEVDKPIKRSRQIDQLLSSRRAWGDISPLLFVASESNGQVLHSLLPNGAQLAFLSSHTQYKKVYHACAQVLDDWGVLLTCMDGKLTTLRLPLQTNSALNENSGTTGPSSFGTGSAARTGAGASANDKMMVLEDTKQTHLFSANEPAKTVCWLSKTNQLRVYDWTATRQLKLRSQFELNDLFTAFAESCNTTGAAATAASAAMGPPTSGGSSGASGGSGGAVMLGANASDFLPVQKMVVLRENVVFFVLKKRWCALNLDNGRLVDCEVNARLIEALDQVSIAIAVPSRIRWSPNAGSDCSGVGDAPASVSMRGSYGMGSWMRSSSVSPSMSSFDVFLAGKTNALVVTLASVAKPHGRVSLVLRGVEDSELKLTTAPKSAYYHHPFLLVEQQPDELVVYSFGVMRPVQTVTIKSFVTACASLSLPIGEERRLGDEEILFAALFTVSASPFAIHLLKMRPISKQIDLLIEHEQFEEASALATLCPEESLLTDQERQVVLAKNALLLFEKGQFLKAMHFFELSGVDVLVVLSLYPEELLPRSIGVANQDTSLTSSSTSSHQQQQNRFTMKDFGEFMKERRPVTQAAIASCSSGEEGLVERLDALIQYLRRLRQSKTSLPRKELIDTVLLKCLVLMMEKPAQKQVFECQLMELVKEEPKHDQAAWTGCELGESEMFLRAHSQFDALLAFYSSRKLHRKALELLEELQQNCGTTSSSTSGDTGSNPPMYLHQITKYLQQLDRNDALLVFEFSRRVLAYDPALGLSIFTQRLNVEDKDWLDLDPALVVNHLKSCHEVGRASSGEITQHEDLPQPAEEPEESDVRVGASLSLPLTDGKSLAIEYLYRVICDGKIKVPARLHDEVVYLLLDAINVELQRNASPTKARLSGYFRAPGAASNAPPPGGPTARLMTRIQAQRGFLGLLRRKLMSFLELPTASFHPERLLSRTPLEMLEERAVILARLRRHQEVLQIYALEMKETALAEAYCNKCFESKTADGSIYSTLLRLYLRPTTIVNGPSSSTSTVSSTTSTSLLDAAAAADPSGTQTQPWRKRRMSFIGNEAAVSAALTLMNRYAERVDVSTALELLPADTTLASLSVFFQHVMERQLDRYRNGQVRKQLAKMENFRVRQQLVTKKQNYVTCWNSTCCYFCRRPIGTGTTVIRLPRGPLAHFACQPNY